MQWHSSHRTSLSWRCSVGSNGPKTPWCNSQSLIRDFRRVQLSGSQLLESQEQRFIGSSWCREQNWCHSRWTDAEKKNQTLAKNVIASGNWSDWTEMCVFTKKKKKGKRSTTLQASQSSSLTHLWVWSHQLRNHGLGSRCALLLS